MQRPIEAVSMQEAQLERIVPPERNSLSSATPIAVRKWSDEHGMRGIRPGPVQRTSKRIAEPKHRNTTCLLAP